MSLLETLASPFQFDFMVTALVIATLIAVPMALLSCFLVIKGWSLMGDAISHAIFPGVVIAYAVGAPYAVGAFAAGMFGWATIEIGVYGILLNVVAIFGCLVAGHLDLRLGSKIVVLVGLVLLIAATAGIISTGPGFVFFGLVPLAIEDSGGLFGTAAEKAYVLFGLLIGLAFGPVQASSRAYLARSVEIADAGRYFGIYALSGRATSFMATLLFSLVTYATDSSRFGMATLILFLAAGLVLLLRTPYPANRTTR